MIVVCPNCSCKYFVKPEILGKGKLVRCAMCGTTWQQLPLAEKSKRDEVIRMLKVTVFWFTVFITVFPLLFARQTVMKYWPASSSFYNYFLGRGPTGASIFSIKKVSSFFIKRDGKLYMGIKGEIENMSSEVQMIYGIHIDLREENMGADNFRASWTQKFSYDKLLPNQKIVFETDLKRVPYKNLICEIKLASL